MTVQNYTLRDFLKKLEYVPMRVALKMVHMEATNAERILLRDKSLTDAERKKLATYIKKLKDYEVYNRAISKAQKKPILFSRSSKK
jgi:hypothetical protein